jgi:hypothetical protein
VTDLTIHDEPNRRTGDDEPVLSAEPVTALLAEYQSDFGDADVATFARGLNLDTRLVEGLLDGRVHTLAVPEIASVCEALYASPYDLWPPNEARTILDVYGPERWPTTIVPLTEPPLRPEPDDAFLARRLRQRADELIARIPSPAIDRTDPDGARLRVPVSIRAYAITGLLGIDANGHITPVESGAAGDPAVEYHFQLARHTTAPTWAITTKDVTAGPPAGASVHPDLARVADALRTSSADPVDAVCFTTAEGATAWIGWDPHGTEWATWDDPRTHFPGPEDLVLTDDPPGLEHPVLDDPALPF